MYGAGFRRYQRLPRLTLQITPHKLFLVIYP
jgi:hypothetical protein